MFSGLSRSVPLAHQCQCFNCYAATDLLSVRGVEG